MDWQVNTPDHKPEAWAIIAIVGGGWFPALWLGAEDRWHIPLGDINSFEDAEVRYWAYVSPPE